MDTIRAFLWKSGHFCRFQKGQGRSSLSPLVVRLWMWLNVHQYPWICLNFLENAWGNCSHYANALNMHEHLTCLKGFWRCLGCQISQDSEYDTIVYVRVLCRFLSMYDYGSIRLNNAWKCRNVPKYPSICLKVTEYC